ncbi:GDYXXLXY domain-containing protein [Microbulbifer sp. JTAC008]|uniref:GDYXXLXY domain-containing protein n=1 Tax=unclassified Microbulbifer TaxID=2619833 RepID=UPI0040394879
MKRRVVIGLVAAIGVQFFILLGMYIKAQMPLWTGQPVTVKTVPVDPRSLFRGNYAQLNYAFSTLDKSLFKGQGRLRQGEVVYVGLEKGASGLYERASVSLEKPQGGVFIRGRVAGQNFWNSSDSYRIRYGIEAYFAPKEKALDLEKQLREGGVAELMISADGRASLKVVRGSGNQ